MASGFCEDDADANQHVYRRARQRASDATFSATSGLRSAAQWMIPSPQSASQHVSPGYVRSMRSALTVWLEIRNRVLYLGGCQQVDLLQLPRWTCVRPSDDVVPRGLVCFVYCRSQDAGCTCMRGYGR